MKTTELSSILLSDLVVGPFRPIVACKVTDIPHNKELCSWGLYGYSAAKKVAGNWMEYGPTVKLPDVRRAMEQRKWLVEWIAGDQCTFEVYDELSTTVLSKLVLRRKSDEWMETSVGQTKSAVQRETANTKE